MEKTEKGQTYRVLLRGEGVDNTGEWVGFFTTRQTRAASKQAAEADAVAVLLAEWRDQARGSMDTMQAVLPIDSRRLLLGWSNRSQDGFTFFNDSEDAENAALRIERRAGGFSR